MKTIFIAAHSDGKSGKTNIKAYLRILNPILTLFHRECVSLQRRLFRCRSATKSKPAEVPVPRNAKRATKNPSVAPRDWEMFAFRTSKKSIKEKIVDESESITETMEAGKKRARRKRRKEQNERQLRRQTRLIQRKPSRSVAEVRTKLQNSEYNKFSQWR